MQKNASCRHIGVSCVWSAAVWLAALAGRIEAAGLTPEFGFEGLPGSISGPAGSVQTIDVFATLTTSGNTTPDGAQAWQISLTAQNAVIKAIAVDGVTVSTIFDDDGLPGTPPLNPHSQDLAGADFKTAQLASASGGRKGAVSAIILRQEQKMVLQPNGKARIAKITLDVPIPASSITVPLTLRYQDGFRGIGQPVKNRVTYDGIVLAPSLVSASAAVSSLPSLAFGFDGCPSEVRGAAGEVVTYDVFATLTTSTNPAVNGAQGWQLSLTAEGGTIKAIVVDDVEVSTIYDNDADPATPDLKPFAFDLGNADFNTAQLATATGGKKGAVSAVVLAQDRKAVLLPNGTQKVARITVEAVVPSNAPSAQVVLRYEDGFRGVGQPVKNLATFDGINFKPTFLACETELKPVPAVAFGFDGCPPTVTGTTGEIKTFEAFATLTTSGNPTPDGPQAWQLSLTAEGGTIKGIAVDGVNVSTIFDDDGLPGTPPVDPFSQDLAGADFKTAQLATATGGKKGAVSAIILRQEQKMVLQPNGTQRIARLTVEVEIPETAGEVVLKFEDGFRGSGQPVKNLATIDGENLVPTLSTCQVSLAPGAASLQLPSDCNQDSKLDISDGICLLEFLFLGARPRLPCGDGTAVDPGNVGLMDHNGDRGVDISDGIGVFGYLFLGEAPPVLGTQCTGINGCPAACE